MDLSILEALIPDLAGWLNVEPATLLLYIGVFCTLCNITSRLIPDDSTGALGYLQRICRILGAHVENRVAPGVKTVDVVKDIVGAHIERRAQDKIRDLASDTESLIPDAIERAADEINVPPQVAGYLRNRLHPDDNK